MVIGFFHSTDGTILAVRGESTLATTGLSDYLCVGVPSVKFPVSFFYKEVFIFIFPSLFFDEFIIKQLLC